MVEKGQFIIADNKRYEVDAIWLRGASKVIDFTARLTEQIGVDLQGFRVYKYRGFSYSVKNWELDVCQMTNNEKLALLNSIEVIDSSACAGELECVYIKPTVTNKAKLRLIGVTDQEIESNLDESGESMDLVPFISNHVKYGWFEERLGGFLTHRPLDTDEAQMELIEASYPKGKTFKEILLGYGYDIKVIGRWTEEQCKAECDDIYREASE